jgi:glycosyltransferase involved in cell wall biosynthesis
MNSLTQTVTYKLFNYLSAGLPVLNSLQSEMVDIIRDNEVGLSNREGDVGKLVENIERFLQDEALLKQYKENALALTAREGDAPVVYERLVQFLEAVAEQAHAASVSDSQSGIL